MLFLSLFILGVSSLIAQIVMTRELIVSFWGNEFFIGWILFCWLFWVAIGCIIVKFLKRSDRGLQFLIGCHLLVTLLFPLTIYWARLSKSLFNTIPGQIPDLMPSVLLSFFVLAPLCLVFGMQFVISSEYGDQHHANKQGASVFLMKAYYYEAIGFVMGGLIFSYGLVFLNGFQTGALLILLNLMMAVIFLSWGEFQGKKYFYMAAFLSACLGLMCFLFSEKLDLRSAALRFPTEQLMETKNSIYGNLAVTRTGDQFNFYESGVAVGTDRDEAFNEALVHFPMLSDKYPQKILLIGSGFSGALREILKYNPKQVYYAELDPTMIDLARSYIPSLNQLLYGGRVILIKKDPRLLLKKLPKDFDVIIINLPNPSTALINRYFTDEFFKEVRGHLRSDGVMATHLKFAADSISGPLGNLGNSIYKSIKSNFSSVVILPEDVLFILASSRPLTNDPKVLIGRLKARGIHTYFITPQAILYRYTTDRVRMTMDAFKNNKIARINTDLHPEGYLYNLIYWLSIFHQDLAVMLGAVMKINFFIIIFLAVGSILLLPLMADPVTFEKVLPLTAMSIGGFSLMSAELLVIYGFQVFYGNLYFKIAWIISAFMAATAVGAFLGHRKLRANYIDLIQLHAGIGAYFILWFLLIWRNAQLNCLLSPILWILCGAGIGVLIGLEFACSNILFVTKQGQGRPGDIYAADLLGSCLGALWVSVFMIPAYGIYKTLIFLIIINLTLAIVLFNSKCQVFSRHPRKIR